MSTSKKPMIRSNAGQIRLLIEHMAMHPNFAAGEFQGPLGSAQYEQQWVQLKAQLDEIGPDRSIQQWKHCWRDQKKKARSEGGAAKRVRGLTGNYAVVPSISENSEIILGTIGHAMAIGIGPEESPIGQRLEQVEQVEPGDDIYMELELPSRATDSLPSGHMEPPPLQASQASASSASRDVTRPRPRPQSAPRQAPSATRSASSTVSNDVNVVRRARARRVHPSERFLAAQLETNRLLMELVHKLEESNSLRREKLRLMRRKMKRL